MKKYNVAVIGVAAVMFVISSFSFILKQAHSQIFEDESLYSSLENKESTLEEGIKLTASKGYKEAYACPMYLLMLSELIYEPERFGDKSVEPATGITKIAKNFAEIIRGRITNSTLQFKDEAIKTKMLTYLNDIINVADTQINCFKTGEGKTLDPVDKYKYIHLDEIIKEAEEIFKTHIYQGDDGAMFAQQYCPFQFLVWSELWPNERQKNETQAAAMENEVVCQDCTKIAELTKDLMSQLKKYYLYVWEEQYAETKDEYKDKFEKEYAGDKEPGYFEPLIKQAEALVEYHRTGNKVSLDTANEYRKEATKKFYDYMMKHGE